jgi:hypothetical protein
VIDIRGSWVGAAGYRAEGSARACYRGCVQKLVDLWYKIPRNREWWFDQFAKVISGCSTGCFTVLGFYAFSVFMCMMAAFPFAKNFAEALTMGLAWGSTLGMLVVSVFGSALLAVIAWMRGV